MVADNPTTRQDLNPDTLADSTNMGYNQAIIANGRLYMSGQVGWNKDFEFAGDDIQSQTRQAFENVEVLLNEINKSFDDVAKVTAHIVDLQHRVDGFLEVWEEVYPNTPYPCLTGLGVDQLYEEALVELEVEVPLEK